MYFEQDSIYFLSQLELRVDRHEYDSISHLEHDISSMMLNLFNVLTKAFNNSDHIMHMCLCVHTLTNCCNEHIAKLSQRFKQFQKLPQDKVELQSNLSNSEYPLISLKKAPIRGKEISKDSDIKLLTAQVLLVLK